jgi:hypothetical protein
MAVVVACVLLVLAGLLTVIRWGGLAVQSPPTPAGTARQLPVGLVVRHYLWYVTVALTAGVTAGILAAAAGGRLVMRLLAVTAGPAAQGQITEANEIVGRISVGGTVGFFLFIGVPFGVAAAAAYLLLRRWLPSRRAGGLALGTLLLLVVGTRIDPLRANNPDFSLVGPAWVAVVAFLALGLFHGMVVAALAGRYSRALPLVASRSRAIAAYAPLLLLIPLFLVIPVIIAAGLVAGVVSQIRPVVALWHDRRVVTVGRVALAAVGLAALPGFVSALVDILGPA